MKEHIVTFMVHYLLKLKRNLLKMKLKYCCLVILVISFSGACSDNNTKIAYEFTNIRRGSLERTVSSSGTINPVSTVKVLPQMSGKVEKIFVDYNDSVRKGDILAELNTDILKLKREQQYATVRKARANYELRLLDYQNQLALADKDFISEYELKTSKTTMDNMAADLAVAEANLKSIDTEINQFAYVKSPIDGIVLDRRINIGDTVVDSSSNNSSTMFTLAENLNEMQIEAGIGELDVVSITKNQPVRFNLESLPGRTFSGEVETLRMVPVISNNVVSYTVIIKVENADGSLLPGMTCAVDFIVEQRTDVLMVSNAALRYQPTNLSAEKISDMVFNASLENMDEEQRKAAIEARAQEQAQAQAAAQSANTGLAGLVTGDQNVRQMGAPGQGRGGRGGGGGGGGQGGNRQAGGDQRQRRNAVVTRNLWYMDDAGKIGVMQVRTGISSGSFTEIRSRDEDLEGRQVILREKI
jgi:HlyD family secretion protein